MQGSRNTCHRADLPPMLESVVTILMFIVNTVWSACQ